MKLEYVTHVNVLFAPEKAMPKLADLQAIKTDNPEIPYRIAVAGAVRNRDGYRTAFKRDIESLRSVGCIFDLVLTDEAKKLIADGKINSKTHVDVKPLAPAPTVQMPKRKEA